MFDASSLSGELVETCLANVKLRYASAVTIQDFVENSFGVKVFRFIESNPRTLLVGRLYNELERIGLKKVFGYGAVSLLDIDQDDQPFPLYLDRVHYSPAMNNWLASRISGFIKIKQTLANRMKLGPTTRAAQSEELLNPNNYPLF